MRKGQLIFRPGTILLILFIAVFGFFMYNWVSSSVTDTGESAVNDQQRAIACSKLDIDFVDLREQDNTTKVSFQTNQNLSSVDVGFHKEDQNKAVPLHDLEKGAIYTAEVNGTGYSNVEIGTVYCGKTFSYK